MRLSRRSVRVLKKRFKQNMYPSKPEKIRISREANIKMDQVNNWFSERRRHLKCKCEDRSNCRCFEKQIIKLKNKKILMKSFRANQLLESTEVNILIQKTKLSEQVIKKWFENKRYRLTKKTNDI